MSLVARSRSDLASASCVRARVSSACACLSVGLVGTRIDDIQDVALLDFVALLEVRGGDVARNARADFDPFDGFEAAGEFVELGDRLRDDLRGLDRRRRRGGASAASLRAQAPRTKAMRGKARRTNLRANAARGISPGVCEAHPVLLTAAVDIDRAGRRSASIAGPVSTPLGVAREVSWRRGCHRPTRVQFSANSAGGLRRFPLRYGPCRPTWNWCCRPRPSPRKNTARNGARTSTTPYINHPIQLAYILVQADIEDPMVLAAALLHDTIEDTHTTHDEIEIVFGHEIAHIVAECSDDKSLDQARAQAGADRPRGAHQPQRQAREARRQDRQCQRHQRRAAGGLVARTQARILRLGKAGGGPDARHTCACSKHASTRNTRSGPDVTNFVSHTVCQPMTPVIRILIFANIGVFLLQQMCGEMQLFTISRCGRWAEYSSRATMHRRLRALAARHLRPSCTAELAHIALNMFALWSFGRHGGARRGFARDSPGCTRPRCFPRRWCNCWW